MSVASRDFLLVMPGDIVVVQEGAQSIEADGVDWWVGYVIHAVGGARDPRVNSLFQVVCVDTGMIRTVNADLVKGTLRPKNAGQLFSSGEQVINQAIC